ARECMQRDRACAVMKPLLRPDLQLAAAVALGLRPASDLPATDDGEPPQVARAARSLRVLLAEDNPVNQRLATEWLRQWGHQVLVADNGLQALERLERETVDLVLMDVQMPEMDGLTAARTIREQERETEGQPRLPIIAMTAHSLHGDRQRCLDAGMDEYLAKPVNQAKLFEVIERLTGGLTGGSPDGTPAASDREQDSDNADSQASESNASDSQTARPGLDRQAVLARCGGDESLMREIIQLLLDNSPAALDGLRRAVAAGDATAIGETAHAFKSSISYFSLEELRDATIRLEQSGRDDDLQAAPEQLARLEECWSGLLPKLVELAQAPLPRETVRPQ
ncbi:MAG: response regulator, partial [Planctomycetales bacterium]